MVTGQRSNQSRNRQGAEDQRKSYLFVMVNQGLVAVLRSLMVAALNDVPSPFHTDSSRSGGTQPSPDFVTTNK